MGTENKYSKEFSTKLIKSRDKLSLVIKYIDKLNDHKPDKEVNDDCVRMLMEVLHTQIEMYNDLHSLPIELSELRFKNNLLRGENNRLNGELELFKSKLGRI